MAKTKAEPTAESQEEIVLEDNQIICLLTGDIKAAKPKLGDNASFYYIKDVMVHPKWQHKRVGTALMQAVNEWLDKNGVDKALVGLYSGDGLRPFYEKFGFKACFGMTRKINRLQRGD